MNRVAPYFIAIAIVMVATQCRAEGESTKPVLLWSSCALPHARYPLESRRKKEEGTTEVRIFVERDGKVTNVETKKSSGHELLDIAARDWVSTCSFKPQFVEGEPIAGWVTIPIGFSEPRPPPPSADAGAFCETQGPEYPIESRQTFQVGTVIARIHVLEDGWPDKILIAKSSQHDRLDAAVKEWIMNCRFKPQMVDGIPFAGWVRQSFTFDLHK